MARNSGVQKRNRAIIRAKRLPCALCGEPIDYGIKYPHPDAFTVDHVVPLSRGGTDSIKNLTAAHFRCNRAKSNGHDPAKVVRRSGSVVIPPGV